MRFELLPLPPSCLIHQCVMYGRPPLGKGFFGGSADVSGAVMYPAFVRGVITAGPEGIRGSGSDHGHAFETR